MTTTSTGIQAVLSWRREEDSKFNQILFQGILGMLSQIRPQFCASPALYMGFGHILSKLTTFYAGGL